MEPSTTRPEVTGRRPARSAAGRRRLLAASAALLLAGSAACSTTPVPAPSPAHPSVDGAWELSASDEFDGSTLDTSLWRPNRYGGTSVDPPFNPNREAAAYDPARVRVGDGHLVLTAAEAKATAGGRDWSWTSGAVSGQGRIVLRDGGLVEARILVPTVGGMWPAFWAVTANTWPPEIDGFEFFDAGTQAQPQFNYHRTDGTQSGPTTYGEPDVDYRGTWHTYGWLRSGGTVTPYVDGKAYPEAAGTGADDRDYFPIINLAVRARPHPAPGTTASVEVDWLRVWQPRQGAS